MRRGLRGSNPVVCGRKFCSGCGHWRHVVDFFPNRRWPNGEPRDLQSRCTTCMRLDRRRRRGHSPRAPRMSRAQARARAAERIREHRRDPAWVERLREYDRIYKEAKRREAGVPPRVYVNRPRVIDRAERVFVDPAPLVAELRVVTGGFTHDVEKIAARSGVPERTILRWRNGSQARIDTVDKVAVALGIPSAVIWGEQW